MGCCGKSRKNFTEKVQKAKSKNSVTFVSSSSSKFLSESPKMIADKKRKDNKKRQHRKTRVAKITPIKKSNSISSNKNNNRVSVPEIKYINNF